MDGFILETLNAKGNSVQVVDKDEKERSRWWHWIRSAPVSANQYGDGRPAHSFILSLSLSLSL